MKYDYKKTRDEVCEFLRRNPVMPNTYLRVASQLAVELSDKFEREGSLDSHASVERSIDILTKYSRLLRMLEAPDFTDEDIKFIDDLLENRKH